jgi:CheY-like chemotaxis protein
MVKKRILIIDNDEVTLALVQALLEGEGFEVATAFSGLGANEHIYGKNPPDLILLDIMMPFQNGIQKLEFLKERESSRSIPVILLSSKPREELEELSRSSGAQGFVVKPVDKGALLAALARHL